ncbi:MAG: winged helix-turn-helix transcriptional regulator [Nanoarchaeota archaeon]
MEQKITLNDKKILEQLDLNARESNSQIAKQAKVSKNIVNYQIRRLEQEGLIKRYITVIDYSKLGYLQFRVFLNFYDLTPGKEEEVAVYLAKEKLTGIVARTSGDWDLIFTAYTHTPGEFQRWWEEFIKKFRSLFKEYATQLVTKEYFYPRTYIYKEKHAPVKTCWECGGSPHEELDAKDQKMLSMLAEDARLPITELAKATGLGSMAIIYRLKQLDKKEVILGYRADIDFTKLGYEHYKVQLELEDPKICSSLQSYLKLHHQVISFTSAISDNVDAEFDLETAGIDGFLQFMEELKKQFSGAIRDYKYIRTLKLHKVNYLPG